MTLRFHKSYFLITVFLFLIEVAIAYFLSTGFIRHFVGDALVVILIFTFVKTFFKVDNFKLALGVLAFSFCVEIAQYFNIVDLLGLGKNRLARIVIGTTFTWSDLLAYTIGCVVAYLGAQNFPFKKR